MPDANATSVDLAFARQRTHVIARHRRSDGWPLSPPIGQESFFVFSKQGKNDLYVGFETSLFKESTDTMRFSYPADHPLAPEFEEQMR